MRSVCLIRHGMPDFPGGRRMCLGSTDLPLGSVGRLQGALAGAAVESRGYTAVYCSRLSRSRETAELTGLPVITREGLEELDAGEWDGLTFDEIRERWPELFARRGSEPSVQPPGAESLEAGAKRFTDAVDAVMRVSVGDIAISAHSSVMQLMLCGIMGLPLTRARELKLPYGSITELGYDGGVWSCGDIGVRPAPEPDAAVCARMLAALDTPAELAEHCAATAREAMRIVGALAAAGVFLDEKLVFSAAYLHDIAKREPDHARTGAEWLELLGYPAEADIIRMHHDPKDEGKPDEALVVFLADKMLLGAERVSVTRRFEASADKCRTPQAREAHGRRLEQTLRAAEAVNSVCGKEIIII